MELPTETPPAPLRNTHRIHVLWPDCDPAGILFYGHYFRWMDDATFFLFEAAGLRKDRMLPTFGVPGMPLVGAHADFRSPVKFGEILAVESAVTQAGNRSFTVSHVFRVGERVTAEGYEKRVWVRADAHDAARIEARPIPPEVRAALGMPPAEPTPGPRTGRCSPRRAPGSPRQAPCSPRQAPCSPHRGLCSPYGPGGRSPALKRPSSGEGD